jgi:hypothetical protein
LTEPTTLELEEIAFNPYELRAVDKYWFEDKRKIQLTNCSNSDYGTTSFGKIEFILKNRTCRHVTKEEGFLNLFDSVIDNTKISKKSNLLDNDINTTDFAAE